MGSRYTLLSFLCGLYFTPSKLNDHRFPDPRFRSSETGKSRSHRTHRTEGRRGREVIRSRYRSFCSDQVGTFPAVGYGAGSASDMTRVSFGHRTMTAVCNGWCNRASSGTSNRRARTTPGRSTGITTSRGFRSINCNSVCRGAVIPPSTRLNATGIFLDLRRSLAFGFPEVSTADSRSYRSSPGSALLHPRSSASSFPFSDCIGSRRCMTSTPTPAGWWACSGTPPDPKST